ncbi:hypothetical protein GCM10010191_11240 [Actinomadura vinacea]|uniref:Amidinotransferase n=1 Tax=Actinomadura vinacea TaxID=115336 RepID=A0ABP5VK18_9ACTN
MIADQHPAAYHGAGWRPRTTSLAQEVAAGRLWARHAGDSEYARLRDVVLAPPDPALISPEDPDRVLHLRPLDFGAVHRELLDAAAGFQELGIAVHFLETGRRTRPDDGPWHNLMFVRDLFFMTPQGAIVSRMGSSVRAGEERYAARTLAELEVPVLRTIAGNGTFEGADALWIAADTLLVGTGNRTNAEGLRQVAESLTPSGVTVAGTVLPKRIQHLLGILQPVDRDLAVVRRELVGPRLRGILRDLGVSLIELDEDAEIGRAQAMNFVTIAPRTVVMAADAPETRRRLEQEGITVAGQVRIDELRKAAGGLACATGILSRDLVG